nr:cytochrome c oxidase subunit II [Gemmatimonadota bacterium]
MAVRWRRLVHRFQTAPAALWILAMALTGCTENYPRTSLAPRSDFARLIDQLFDITLGWGLVVFILVESLLVYIVWRYRQRGADDRPEQVHGHTRLEIAWTLVPIVILLFIGIPTVRTIFATQENRPIPGALQVRVVGHQWWWEFEYPELGILTANELHLPVGRTASFDLQSADIIHSFWVPRLGGKRDAIPPHTNRLWFTPDSAGTYLGQCAEYCGASHALMGFRVVADSPEDFEAWVANQRRPA